MPKARSELNEYIFDDLQFVDQTRHFEKKREVPYGIKKEKRNNANKLLKSIISTHHEGEGMLQWEDTAPHEKAPRA